MNKRLFVVVVTLLSLAGISMAQAQKVDPLLELTALADKLLESSDANKARGQALHVRRAADPAWAMRLKDPRNIEAQVTRVQAGQFPCVALKVKVLEAAEEGPGTGVSKNEALVIVPHLVVHDGQVDLQDVDTLTNAGAFFLHDGDDIVMRLGQKKGRVWEAEYIERSK